MLLGSSWAGIAYAQQVDTPPAQVAPAVAPAFGYTKDVRDADGKIQAVQSAIRRFDAADGKGPTVYLVAAVHIGEKDYYKQLNTFLGKQDVVLYEGVRPSPKAKTSAAPPAPPVSSGNAPAKPAANPASIQKKLSDVLHLQFQLEAINYKLPNFRNSDLDWDTMESLAAKKGEKTATGLSELKNTLSGGPNAGTTGTMLTSVVEQAGSDPAIAKILRRGIVELIADPNRIAAAQQQMGGAQSGLKNVLIAERNKVVLANIKELMNPAKADPQKPVHSVAVFFGAEHMRDMEQHLVSDLGYRAADAQWITAINAETQDK